MPVVVTLLIVVLGVSGCSREPEIVPAPSQMRRLTESQYRQTIADVFGSDIRVVGRFEPDLRVDGLLAVGTSLVSMTANGLEQYETTAREIALQVVSPAHRDRLIGCQPDQSAAGRECAEKFLTGIGTKLFRRPLSAEEVQTALTQAQLSAQQLNDAYAGLAASLTGLLTAPDFLFRLQTVATNASQSSRHTLDGWSRATQLSFFLWNASPDDALLAAAAAGELDTPEGMARQTDRLIDSSRLNDGVRAFFDDFLQLDGLGTLAKDSQIFPAFIGSVAGEAREQTLRTIVDHLVVQRGDYRDLFTTRRIAMNRTLSPVYEVPAAGKDWSIQEFPQGDPRVGLLTHVSFLALHSHPGRTSPTLRGKALREILMCQTVPTPPANVNFTVVQDVSNPHLKTTRARLEAHLSDSECASCHKLTDPMGLALEKFDGIGRFRETENGAPIDTVASLENTEFDGAGGLGAALRNHPAVTSCLVQSMYRYATGRSTDRTTRPFLAYIEKRFAQAHYRVPDLMRAIATSKTFYAIDANDASEAALASSHLPHADVPNSKETR
jgi:hypothetical protein